MRRSEDDFGADAERTGDAVERRAVVRQDVRLAAIDERLASRALAGAEQPDLKEASGLGAAADRPAADDLGRAQVCASWHTLAEAYGKGMVPACSAPSAVISRLSTMCLSPKDDLLQRAVRLARQHREPLRRRIVHEDRVPVVRNRDPARLRVALGKASCGWIRGNESRRTLDVRTST